MTFYSGAQFLIDFPDNTYYKLTNEDETYGGEVYFKTGIFVSKDKFTPESPNVGLVFYDKEQVVNKIEHIINGKKPKYLRKITLLNNSIIYEKENKYHRTNTCYINDRVELFDSDIWDDMDLVKKLLEKDKKYLNLIKRIPNDMYLEYASDVNTFDINRFKNEKDLQIKIKLIRKFPSQFRYLDDQSQELCDLAVECEGSNIEYIKNQTENQCWKALFADPNNIEFIANPTEDMILSAVTNSKCVTTKINVNLMTPKILKIISHLYYKSDGQLSLPKTLENINGCQNNTSTGETFDKYTDGKTLSIENKKIISDTMRQLLENVETAKGKQNKKEQCLIAFDYVINNSQFLKEYPNFRKTVVKKLEEFKRLKNFSETEANYYLDAIEKVV